MRRWKLIDTERIEAYDFFGTSFDESSGLLTIEGNIPLVIEIEVERFIVTGSLPTS